DRLERIDVERARRAVFLEREDIVLEVQHVRIGRAAAQALDARIVERRIAVHREKISPGLVLRDVALRLRVAGLVIDAAVLDPEHPDVAFAVEHDIARSERVLRVGTRRVETAVQVVRDLALDLAVPNFDLGSNRSVIRASPRSRSRRRRARFGLRLRQGRPLQAAGADYHGAQGRRPEKYTAIDAVHLIGHWFSPSSDSDRQRRPAPADRAQWYARGRRYQPAADGRNCRFYVCFGRRQYTPEDKSTEKSIQIRRRPRLFSKNSSSRAGAE